MGHMIKIQVDGYFNHHGFEEIPLNRFGGKLCAISFLCNITDTSAFLETCLLREVAFLDEG